MENKKKFFVIGLFLIIIAIIIVLLISNSFKSNNKKLDQENTPNEELGVNDKNIASNPDNDKDSSNEDENKIETNDKEVEVKEPEPEKNNEVEPDQEEPAKPVNPPTVNKNIVGQTSLGYDIEKIDGLYYVKGILIANKSYALPSNYNPGALTPEFTEAFTAMQKAAKKDGISITIRSGYRSYGYQKTLYNKYVNRDGKAAADTYSARPGHSEHQTGLAADLNKISDTFGETKEGKWLANNCYKYGFILRYPKGKESITGYVYEPWHFRYIGDEAVNLYNNGNWITLEEYLGIDSKY